MEEKLKMRKKKATRGPAATVKKPVKSGEKTQDSDNLDDSAEIKVRVDSEFNNTLIMNALIELTKKKEGKKPTLREIAEETGLHINTIYRHGKTLKFEPKKDIMRSLTPEVVWSIFISAKKGSSRSQELWLRVMEGWVPQIKTAIHHRGLSFNENEDPKDARDHYIQKLRTDG